MVWNRACDYDFEPTLVGDKLLKASVQFDALVNNGGLGHTIHVAEPIEVQDALTGLRRFGLDDAARVVETALGLNDEDAQEAMTDEYHDAVQSLDAAFEEYYSSHIEEFAPPG